MGVAGESLYRGGDCLSRFGEKASMQGGQGGNRCKTGWLQVTGMGLWEGTRVSLAKCIQTDRGEPDPRRDSPGKETPGGPHRWAWAGGMGEEARDSRTQRDGSLAECSLAEGRSAWRGFPRKLIS